MPEQSSFVPDYVTTGQAAAALGFHIRTLQRAIRNGDIQPHSMTPGGHPRWDIDRLQRELLDRHMRRRGRS